MITSAAAYYHWPTLWAGAAPTWATHPISLEQGIDVSVLGDEVYRSALTVGIPVRVLREGMFIFDFSNWEPGRPLPREAVPDFDAAASVALRRSTLMNAHLACLHTAIKRLQNTAHLTMVVTPSELISIDSFEESLGGTGSDFRLAALSVSRFASTYNPALPAYFDWRLQARFPTVEVPTLEESFRLLDVISNHASEDLLDMIDLYTRGCRAYQDHNYSLCLVTMWTIAERLLRTLWKRYVEENRQREIDGNMENFITGDRRKTLLKDTRTYTAAVMSEILSLTEQIPFQLYRELTNARSARNHWVHDLEPVSRESAQASVKVAEQMFRLVEDVDLEIPLNLQLHG